MNQQLANVHPEAKIGENVTIAPFSTIEGDVEIGDGTWIGPNAVIMDGARIGKNCKIFPGAVISAVPQDLKYNGEKTTAVIGDNTIIREFVTMHKGTADQKTTKIGSNCLIMIYVHIAHDCLVGNGCIIAGYSGLAGHCVVEDFVVLEGLVAVQQFIKIGAHSFIAGASRVRKNVPPYVKGARDPLSYAGINSIGLTRKGYDEERIREIESIYRTIYVLNQNIGKALEIVEKEAPDSPEKTHILEFIRASDKGIMKAPPSSNGQ